MSGDAALWPVRRFIVKAGCGQAGQGFSGHAMAGDEDRKKRLSEALRENLRRRKAQARGGAGERGENGEAGPIQGKD